jgi:hypothetical protein
MRARPRFFSLFLFPLSARIKNRVSQRYQKPALHGRWSTALAELECRLIVILLGELEVRRQIRAPKTVASRRNNNINRVALLPHI